jgi:transcription factor SPN1
MSQEPSDHVESPVISPVGSPVEQKETYEATNEFEVNGDDDNDNNKDDDDEDDEDDQDFHDDVGGVLDENDLNKIKVRKRAVNPDDLSEPTVYEKQRANTQEPQDAEPAVHYSNETTNESHKRRQDLEARMERALKKPKMRKRKDEHDLTNDEDEVIQILKQEMDIAAKKDSEVISKKDETGISDANSIAINKIQLLPRVDEILSKVNLAEVILDNNLLAEVRQWLEPLPDASLPSYDIQKVLFSALLKLPINTNHLRESGIGKILLFYQKSKRVEPKIKRIADKLISDWTRPIIGASDNYRDKQIHSVDFDSLKFASNRQRSITSSGKKVKLPAAVLEKSIYEQQAERRNRAAAPVQTVTDYKFAPKSKIDKTQSSLLNAGVGTSLNRDDQFKRINQKLSGRRTTTKKGGVSIEGRSKGF